MFLTKCNSGEHDRALTLTQKNVFWQIPEGGLHHIKVPAAHAVHEGGQEVCCQAAAEKLHMITLNGVKNSYDAP